MKRTVSVLIGIFVLCLTLFSSLPFASSYSPATTNTIKDTLGNCHCIEFAVLTLVCNNCVFAGKYVANTFTFLVDPECGSIAQTTTSTQVIYKLAQCTFAAIESDTANVSARGNAMPTFCNNPTYANCGHWSFGMTKKLGSGAYLNETFYVIITGAPQGVHYLTWTKKSSTIGQYIGNSYAFTCAETVCS